MSDTDVSKQERPTRWGYRLFVACLVGAGIVSVVLICQVPRWMEEAQRRSRKESLARQIANVKAGKTACIYHPDPTLLDDLVGDAECAEKVREVLLGEMFPPDIARNRYSKLKSLPHLETVSIVYTGRSDALLEDIQGMASLEELQFYRAGLTKAGARHLTSFPNLKRLFTDHCTDPAAFEVLKHHAAIENLLVTSDRMTPEQVAVLKTLPKLRSLGLYVGLPDRDVLDLHGLSMLERLGLGGPAATDAALAGLEDAKNLMGLGLSNSRITDAGLTYLRKLRHLKRLDLSGRPTNEFVFDQFKRLGISGPTITDAGLAMLTELTGLEELDLSDTKVTDEGAKKLQQALPNCKITWERAAPASQARPALPPNE